MLIDFRFALFTQHEKEEMFVSFVSSGYDCLTGHCQHHYGSTYTEVTKIIVNYQEPPKKLDSESHPAPNNSK